MDENAVVLISRGSMFLVNNVRDKLTESGYYVMDAAPTVEELSEYRHEANNFILYLGDYIEECKNAIIFLKDSIIEDENNLYVIGSPDEINQFYKIAPKSCVRKALTRPLNVKDLIAVMEDDSLEADRKKTILVIDDDATYLRSIHDWLSGKDQVVMVNSGMNALTYLASHKPDLILLDYSMPVADGPMVMEMIRSDMNLSKIPIIFLTGKSDRESVSKVLELRPAGYLLKSLNPYQLVKSVDHFFEKRKLEQV